MNKCIKAPTICEASVRSKLGSSLVYLGRECRSSNEGDRDVPLLDPRVSFDSDG